MGTVFKIHCIDQEYKFERFRDVLRFIQRSKFSQALGKLQACSWLQCLLKTLPPAWLSQGRAFSCLRDTEVAFNGQKQLFLEPEVTGRL